MKRVRMKVAFRVDASFEIGTGHFMRCLTLADYLSANGALVSFLCRYLPPSFRDTLNSKGFEFIDLTSFSSSGLDFPETTRLAHATWLGVSQLVDARACSLALNDKGVDWLIVDHYAIDKCWEEYIRPFVHRIMVIDDLADRDHDCDLFLDQNYYPEMDKRYLGRLPASCEVLLGPSFSLLREEFRIRRGEARIRDAGVRRILVFFGGVDATNFTEIALLALQKLGAEQLVVDVVVGAQHPCLGKIQELCDRFGFIFHIQTSRMGELMLLADLALGATGATSWERCCLGLPSVTVSLADNQIDIAFGLELTGSSVYLGCDTIVEQDCIFEKLSVLINKPEIIMAMSKSAFSLVDGEGVRRVSEALAR